MKKTHMILSILVVCLSYQISAQISTPDKENLNPRIALRLNLGYDLPSYGFNFEQIDYLAGLKFGLGLDYRLGQSLYAGIDYDFLINAPASLLTDNVAYPAGLSSISSKQNRITRQFLGLGPTYLFPLSSKLSANIGVRGGISMISGGDILGSALDPATSSRDYHLLQTGFDDRMFAAKGKMGLRYSVTPSFAISLEGYYLHHYSVHADDNLDINSLGNLGLVYGSSDFDISGTNPYTVTDRDALVITENHCGTVTSFGINIGVVYSFGMSTPSEKPTEREILNDGQDKLIINSIDGPSGAQIAECDIVVKDLSGNVIATGSTNNFGLLEVGRINKGNYLIEGKLFGVNTSIAKITTDDFGADGIARVQIFYEDLRFILKGVAVNKKTRANEPNVVVNLTNTSTSGVEQDNTNGKGVFEFRLDPNASYEVVGIKENRLSDIDRASTVGLTRSTTLFVELQLGLDDFDCGRGTVLDIKYEYDKADLLPESRFELDRLVRYMNDHNSSRIELSAHTDARGSSDYNLSLSERRARSAVDYIVSRGMPLSRITAQGYGESTLLNDCSDGVNCSEAEHSINRRTEAKLLCK